MSKKNPSTNIFFAVLLFLAITLTISAVSFFLQRYRLNKNPQIIAQKEAQNLLKKLNKLTSIPIDEIPEIATVTDKSQVNTQTFFKNVENGDKLIIFSASQKAILYRPSQNKIIDITTITTATTSSEQN